MSGKKNPGKIPLGKNPPILTFSWSAFFVFWAALFGKLGVHLNAMTRLFLEELFEN